MGRRNKGILEELVLLPWWASIIAAALVYLSLKVIMPAMMSGTAIGVGLASGFQQLAGYAAAIFLLPAPFAYLRARQRAKLLDVQNSLESIRALSWQQFEHLVGEAFRRQGYVLVEHGGGGPDDGIDLMLHRAGETVLVQCKQWRARQVGVSVVREQFGILTARNAAAVMVVTSGTFTGEAETFARGKPITLIDGPKLLDLVQSVQTHGLESRPVVPAPSATPADAPACPTCGGLMTIRTARRGQNTGQEFWGCTQFPQCRGTRPR